MNNWNAIRKHYDWAGPLILAGRPDEWAIDAYAWDCGIMQLTHIEDWLWQDMRQANIVMYPQWPVDNMFLDFANPVAKVVIECDGVEFHRDQEKDNERDSRLAAQGWTIYRAPGWLCRTEFNEETNEKSEAREFLDDICTRHRIKRNTGPREWVHIGKKEAA